MVAILVGAGISLARCELITTMFCVTHPFLLAVLLTELTKRSHVKFSPRRVGVPDDEILLEDMPVVEGPQDIYLFKEDLKKLALCVLLAWKDHPNEPYRDIVGLIVDDYELNTENPVKSVEYIQRIVQFEKSLQDVLPMFYRDRLVGGWLDSISNTVPYRCIKRVKKDMFFLLEFLADQLKEFKDRRDDIPEISWDSRNTLYQNMNIEKFEDMHQAILDEESSDEE